MRHFLISTAFCFCALVPMVRSLAAGPETEPVAAGKDWVFLANDDIRVGLLRSHGGAIGHLSAARSDFNVLNHYDHGRLVQQSYYGDRDGSKWVDKPWRYNPVQGGDYRGKAAEVSEIKTTATTAYVKTIPRHWASGELLSECVMEQWIELDGPVVAVEYRFTYRGSKMHTNHHQETPAVFISPKLATLVTYEGKEPWTGGSLIRRVPGWPNESARLDENWAAYVDENDEGVGVFVPGVTEATCYRYQGGADSDCSYVAPLHTFAIMPELEFSYCAYFTVGATEVIRDRFSKIHQSKNSR